MAEHTPEQKSFALYQTLSEQKRMRAERLVVAAPAERDFSALPFWVGLGCSVAWVVIVAIVLVSSGEARSFGGVPLINWGVGLSALTAPIALIWMVTAYLQRASDVQVITDPLRQQLNLILSEQGIAEGRVSRFNNVLREQIALLRESGTAGEYEISRLLQRLEEEKVAIKKLSKHSAGHVEQAEKIMQAAEQFERLMASNLREVQEIESRLEKHQNGIESSTQDARELLNTLADEIVTGSRTLAQNLAAAKADGMELRDFLRAQEIDLQNATSGVKSVLTKSAKDFTNILDRFHDDASTANSALSKIGDTISGHTSALQQAGTRLPEQVSQAAAKLQEAVDRYRALEQSAQSSAEATAQRLSTHAQTLDQHLGSFRAKQDHVDQNIAQQQSALNAMLDRINATSTVLSETLATATSGMAGAADNSLARYRTLTQQMQAETQDMCARLQTAAQQFETAAAQAAAHTASHRDNIQIASDQVSRYTMQLDAVDRHTSESARAARAQADDTVRAIQQVQERLVAMRDELTNASTQTRAQLQQETAAQQQMIGQLTAAAQAGAETLQRTTQSYSTQQKGLAVETKDTEARLQTMMQQLSDLQTTSAQQYNTQLDEMNRLLTSTATQLQIAEQQIKNFGDKTLEPVSTAVAQIKQATQDSTQRIEDFAQRLAERAALAHALGNELVDATTDRIRKATEEGTQQLRNFSTQAAEPIDAVIARIQDVTTQSAAQLQDFSVQAAKPIDAIVSKIQDATAQSAQQLRNFSAQAAEPIDAIVSKIQDATTQSAAQLQDFSIQAAKPIDAIVSKIQDATAQSAQQLQSFSTQALPPIDAIVDRIRNAAAASAEHLRSFSADAAIPMQEAVDQIKDITAQGTQQLRDFSARAISPIDNIVERIKSATDAGAAHIEEFTANVATPVHDAIDAIKQATMQSARQLEALGTDALTPIDLIVDRIASVADESTAQIRRFSADAVAPLHDAVAQITEVTAQGAQQLQAFSTRSLDPVNTAVSRIREATQESTQQIDDLGVKLATAADKLKEVSAGIMAVADEQMEHLATAGAQQLAGFGNRALEPVNIAVTRIKEAAAEGATYLETFSAQLATHVTQLNDVGVSVTELTTEQTRKIAEAGTQQLQEFSARADAPINAAIARITAATEQGTAQLQTFGLQAQAPVDEIVVRIKDVTEASARQLDAFGATLADRVAQARDIGADISKTALEQTQLFAAAATEQIQEFTAQAHAPVTAAISRLTEATQQGAKQLQEFSLQAQAPIDHLAGKIRVVTTESGQLLNGFGTQLNDRVAQIQDIAGNLANLAADQARKIADVGVQQLQEFSTLAQAPIDAVVAKVRDAATESTTHLDQFSATLAQRAEQVKTVGTEIADLATAQTRQIAEAAAAQVEEFGLKADAPITAALDRVKAATQEGTHHLEEFSANLASRATQVQELSTDIVGLAIARVRQATEEGAQELDAFSQRAATPIQTALTQIKSAAAAGTRQMEEFGVKLVERAQQAQELNATLTADAIDRFNEASHVGTTQLESFEQKLTERAVQLQDMGARLAEISTQIDTTSVKSDTTVAVAVAKLLTLQQQHELVTQQLQQQIDEATAKLHSEIDALGAKATQTSAELEQASAQVGAHGKALSATAQESTAQMHTASTVLVDDASQLRSALEQQHETLESGIAKLQTQLAAAQELFKEKADSSYTLLDHTGTRFNELATLLAEEMEKKNGTLHDLVLRSMQDASNLGNILHDRIHLIGQSNDQLQSVAGQISGANAKIITQLQQISEESAQVSARFHDYVAENMVQLATVDLNMQQRQEQLEAVAETAVATLQRTGAAISVETQKLDALAEQHQTQADSLAANITKLGTASTETTSVVEQNSQRLMAQLQEQILRLQETDVALQEKVAQALVSAEQAQSRFGAFTDSSTAHLVSRLDELRRVQEGSEQSLGSFGANFDKHLTSLDAAALRIESANSNISTQLQEMSANSNQSVTLLQETIARHMARFDEIDQNLQYRQQKLTAEAEVAVQTLNFAGEALATQGSRFTEITTQHSEAAQKIAENIALVTDASAASTVAMEQSSRELLIKLQFNVGQLKQTSEMLQQNVAAAVVSAEEAHSRFDTLAGNSAAPLNERVVELQQLHRTTEHSLATFAASIQDQLATLADIGQQVAEQQHSITLTSTTQRDELVTLFDRLAAAHHASAAAADQAVTRLADVAQTAQSSLENFSSGAQTTMGSMRAAGTNFAEQAQTILAQSQQSEQQIRSVMAVTTALTEHAKQLREQTQLDAARIGENMAVVIGQLDGGAAKLNTQVNDAIAELSRGGAVVQDQMQNFLVNITSGNEAMQRQVQGLLSQVGQNHVHLRDTLKEHAQSLGEQYGIEAARMSENLQKILAQIESACGWLRAQTSETMSSLDKSAGHFSVATEGAARTLMDQAGRLDETALRLNARLQSLGSALRDEQSTLDHTSAKIEQHAVVMAEQTAKATQQLRALLESMVQGEDQTQSLSRQIAGQMQGVVIHLREELQRLNDYSTTAAKSAHDVAAQIGVHANDLLEATTHIQNQCAQLPQTVDQASQRLAAAGTTLREHAAVASDAIDESVAHFIEVTRTNQATLTHNTQSLQRAAEDADNTLQTFTRQFGLQLHHLHEGRDIITTEQQKLTEQSMTALAQLIAASEQMASLRASASAAHEQLVGQIAFLDDRAQSSTKTLTLHSDAMGQQVRALSESAKKTELQLVVSTDHYRAQLNEMRAALEGNLEAIDKGINRTSVMLERKSTDLQQATGAAIQEIDRLIGRFALTAQNGTATVEEKTAHLRALAEDTAQLLLGFGTTLDNQLQHMAHAGDMVLKTRDTLAGTIAQSIDQVDSLQHKLENSRMAAQSSTDQVATQLQKLGANLQQHIDRLQSGTQQAVNMVHGASEGWQDQAQNLARVAQQARGELAAISFAMDALLQKGETMRSEVRNQGKDIATSLAYAMDQIEHASDELGGDESLVSRIERGLKKIS